MIILIVGGSKSSKSFYGERFANMLSSKGKLYYLATMNPYDLEDLKRIEEHIKNREEYNFTTIEQKSDLHNILHKFSSGDTVLLDSVTSLATNEMFMNENFNENISEKISKDIMDLSQTVNNLIIVSDYVFSDSIIYDSYTERFRRELGHINCNIAKLADSVIEASYGNLIYHKGKEVLENEKLI